MLRVSIKYSMRDLISDFISYCARSCNMGKKCKMKKDRNRKR